MSSGARGCEAHLDLESAFGAGASRDLGSMSLRNRLDDGQAEPVSVGVADTVAAGLLKRLEESSDITGSDHRAGVLTVMVAIPERRDASRSRPFLQ